MSRWLVIPSCVGPPRWQGSLINLVPRPAVRSVFVSRWQCWVVVSLLVEEVGRYLDYLFANYSMARFR